MEARTDHPVSLERVRGRREALHTAMMALEQAAISSPAADAASEWRDQLESAASRLVDVLDHHIAEVEAPDGFFAEVLRHEPRVASHVERLRAEHATLHQAAGDLLERCRGSVVDARQLREDVLALLALLSQHQHAGADLLYEAYEVDVSVGD